MDAEYRVRIYLQKDSGTEIEYLKTLAHELHHLWQYVNRIAQTERRAVEYENDFVDRFYDKGPETDPYDGAILGLAILRRCTRCGNRIHAGDECPICIARDNQAVRKATEAEAARMAAEAEATKTRLADERRQDVENSRRRKEIEWWRHNIDSHPDNGKDGFWIIQGQFYVRATSAGEALIKVAGHISTNRLKARFVGDKVPRGLTPLR